MKNRVRASNILIAALWILSSCAAVLDVNDPAQVAANVSQEFDQFDQTTTYKGPRTSVESQEGITVSYFLRAFDTPEGDLVQLYAVNVLPDWYFLEFGRVLGDRQPKRLRRIDSDVNCSQYGCTIYETVGLEISPSQLRAGSKQGIAVQFVGRGKVSFSIPASYVAGFYSVWSNR